MIGALSFTAPMILLGALALPVVWWLLRATPPAPMRKAFGGMVFLDKLENRTETPARTPWWLTLIRLAALGLLLLGLAGPVLNANDEVFGDRPLLIIADDGWTSGANWTDHQQAVKALAFARGADRHPARILFTTGDVTLTEPMSLSQAAEVIGGHVPTPALPDRAAAIRALEAITLSEMDVLWLSDGTIGRRGADRTFINALGDANHLHLFRVAQDPVIAIRNVTTDPEGMVATLSRVRTVRHTGQLRAFAADGRLLAEAEYAFGENENTTTVRLALPPILRNDVARLSLVGVRSAGAIWLVDSRERQVSAGLVTRGSDTLRESGFYLRQALAPHATLYEDPLAELISSETGLIVLDDIGTIRPSEETALVDWINDGGVLLRMAGPNTANAASGQSAMPSPTLPVTLRSGTRAFGGALTWEDPQPIAPFTDGSPFVGLDPAGVNVRRQVLNRPSVDTGAEVWASLEDGTPLVSAKRQGDGLLILFHVTASPTWSDLPISGLFPLMLERVAQLAVGAPAALPDAPLAPYRLLDGYGVLRDPPANARAVPVEDLAAGTQTPGLYGDAASPLAVNTYPPDAPTLDVLTAGQLPLGTTIRGPTGVNVRAFGPPILALALIIFAIDAVALALRGLADQRMAARTAASMVLGFILTTTMFASSSGHAQSFDLRPDLGEQAVAAALDVRLAYVETGIGSIDRLSQAGLYGLTREAHRRSALEPGMPVGVDIEEDDLSVYPLLYWPVDASAPPPSDSALSRLETFMAGGGLLIIDTQDGERQTTEFGGPNGETLRAILLRMNIPPLEPLPADHILKKSFYYLDTLHGRNSEGVVWVEAASALRESNDGVPSLIIAGRDWAAAWAVDDGGVPLRPAGPGGERRREFAYRVGINMAMVALTGNYKGDQVHVQALLDRLQSNDE